MDDCSTVPRMDMTMGFGTAVKKQKILLLQDNFSGHIVSPDLQNIWVENFEPNLTAHVQPLDQGII